MNPKDAPKRDWNLYYTGCHLLIRGRPYGVDVIHEAHRIKLRYFDGREWKVLSDTDLKAVEIWWPRPGAYQYKGFTYYIGRRARRSMRKSASAEHYYVVWSNSPLGGHVMEILAEGDNATMPFDEAIRLMEKKIIGSAPITKDLIIFGEDPDYWSISFKGTPVGRIDKATSTFIPDLEGSPIAKRAGLRLLQEGICC